MNRENLLKAGNVSCLKSSDKYPPGRRGTDRFTPHSTFCTRQRMRQIMVYVSRVLFFSFSQNGFRSMAGMVMAYQPPAARQKSR